MSSETWMRRKDVAARWLKYQTKGRIMAEEYGVTQSLISRDIQKVQKGLRELAATIEEG
ncbi:hypothetical protein D3C75_1165290 [compost metagenome]